jgi:acyl carrier protein phosphodiesterase
VGPRSAPRPRRRPLDRQAPTRSDCALLKLQLQRAQDKLLLIDPNRLDDVAHAAWSNEIFELSRAINALRNVLLEQLSADFLAELPDIEDASKDLADELQELEDAVDVINAVAGVLGVIARIATLVA